MTNYCTQIPTPESLTGNATFVKILNKNKPSLLLACLYAPCGNEQEKFFKDVREFLDANKTLSPILVGDFNTYFSPSDSFANSARFSKELATLMSNYCLKDAFREIHPNDVVYTWYKIDSQTAQLLSASRLDHLLIKQTLLPEDVEFLPSPIPTDHLMMKTTLPWTKKNTEQKSQLENLTFPITKPLILKRKKILMICSTHYLSTLILFQWTLVK
jgi:exonuclease III